MELKRLDEGRLSLWRKAYRNQLGVPVVPDFQDAFCRIGQAYQVETMGQPVGYAVLAEEPFIPGWGPVLSELFLEIKPAKFARQIIRSIIEKLNPEILIGRTDDPAGFPLLMDLALPNQIASSLYLLDREPDWVEDRGMTIVESTIEDAQRLLPLYASVPATAGGIPDEVALMKSLAAWRHYRLLAGRELLAVCYVAPQDTSAHIAVNPIVAEASRGKGLGRYLAAFAARRELAENKVCIAVVEPEQSGLRGLVETLGARLAAHFIHWRRT